MPDTAGLSRTAVRGLMIGLLAVLGGLALALNLPSGHAKAGAAKGSATSAAPKPGLLKGQPLPVLFPDSRLPAMDTLVASEVRRARRDAKRYLASHPGRNDTALVGWALDAVGPPPGRAVQQRELRRLYTIAALHTAPGVKAATWLEVHGKHDVWKLFFKQYSQFAEPRVAKAQKLRFKDEYALAKMIAAVGKSRFARPSPYIADPSLHAINQGRTTRKFSYPSKHSVISYALLALLTRLEPHRAGEFTWMTDEISYSRLYGGGHYPSDIAAGAYLGTLIDQYEQHVPPPAPKPKTGAAGGA